ncbi:MAG TPA: hypothetical protein VGR47_01885 [Terracidiphilus sp.]|nr:hypothetical protein [Terracidiphilus sp.]
MQSILEEIQKRISDSERRVNEAGKQLQTADKAYNAAVSELQVWRSAFDAEIHAQQEAKSMQGVLIGMEPLLPPAPDNIEYPPEQSETAIDPMASVQAGGLNKTELIRSLLRENPAGLTPPQIWERVAGQFKHRPYMYSVLKRLKDHDEVVTRRNKYLLRQNQEASQSLTIQ